MRDKRRAKKKRRRNWFEMKARWRKQARERRDKRRSKEKLGLTPMIERKRAEGEYAI